ncbi:MAG: Integrase [Nocardioidaceae bacterium]|jgi:integrase|nr:Integrase [Nocardioidaceae bacterium]
MAWIDCKTRSDGGMSAVVRWRMGGSRTASKHTETFGAGSDEQNLARPFYERILYPLIAQLRRDGIAPFRFHDLRHTHVAWLVAGGAPLPHIQARLGHESITTTIDTYGHLLPVGDELISEIIDTALPGGEIRPAPLMRLVAGSEA